MKYNGYDINTMYVEREGDTINLYGSHFDQETKNIVVVRSTKNMSNLAQQVFGDQYTNERFIAKLKDRSTHNFIGWLAGPLSMPTSMDAVSFVD